MHPRRGAVTRRAKKWVKQRKKGKHVFFSESESFISHTRTRAGGAPALICKYRQAGEPPLTFYFLLTDVI